jgi:uncharacterized protein YajQ (UPF0234 family)
MKNALTIAFTLLISIGCFAQKEKVELNLTKGQTYVQRMVTDMTIGQTVAEQQLDIKMTMNAKITYRVINVMDSVYDLEVKYENLSMKMGMPTGEMNFDSEKKDANDMMSTMLSSMKNNPFNLKMTKSGHVIDVKNIENLFNFDKFTELTQAQKDQFKTQLSESYGEKTFKSNMESSMAIFPKGKVGKGDKWTVNGKLESGMSADIVTVYELKEIMPDYFVISGQSSINTLSKEYIQKSGMDMRYDLKGTMTAEIKIDKKTGWIIESKMNQDISGITEIKDNERMPGGMKIPMKLVNKITVTDK